MIKKLFLLLAGKILPHQPGTPQLLEQDISDIGITTTIDHTNFNFKGQQRNEMVLCFCRKHWIVLLKHFVGFGVLTLLFAYLFFVFLTSGTQGTSSAIEYTVLLLLIVYTYAVHYFYNKMLNYFLGTLIITNTRIVEVDKTLFFRNNRESTDLHEIKDMNVHQQGIVKTLLNYGEISIIRGSEMTLRTLECVPNPDYHFRKINKAKRGYLLQRTMAKARLPQMDVERSKIHQKFEELGFHRPHEEIESQVMENKTDVRSKWEA